MLVTEMVADAGGVSMPGVEALSSFILLCNACITAFFFGIGTALIVGRKSACQTLFGKMVLVMMAVFWLVRLIAPYFLLPEGVTPLQIIASTDVILDIIFILMIALSVAPLILHKRQGDGSSVSLVH